MSNITKMKVHEGMKAVPEGVTVNIESGKVLIVTGPLGTVKKSFLRVPVEFELKAGKILYRVYWKGKKGFALANTISSIIDNLFTGVSMGYTYKMKIYYRHFPMSVEVKGGEVLIKNFQGERGVRKARIIGNTNVRVEGNTIIITGISKEDVGTTAANISAACKVKDKDPRIFLDGIYLYERKEGIEGA